MSLYKKYSMTDFMEKGYEIFTDFMFQVLKLNGISLMINEDRIKDAVYLIATDAEPVRHGRWISHGSYFTCSACGEEQYGIDTGRYYCPNCGAKMDGGEYETV